MKLTQEYFDQQLENFQINIISEFQRQTQEIKNCIDTSFKTQHD